MNAVAPEPAFGVLTLITSEVIDEQVLAEFVHTAEIGATMAFVGRVRDHDHGKAVVSLEYEAHPSAHQTLESIAVSARLRDEGIRIAAVHRVGQLGIGDAAMAVYVGSAHRAGAITACSTLVEEIKAKLPIWKLQTFADGTTEWVNCL